MTSRCSLTSTVAIRTLILCEPPAVSPLLISVVFVDDHMITVCMYMYQEAQTSMYVHAHVFCQINCSTVDVND